MKKLLLSVAALRLLSTIAQAAPQQPTEADFKLETWVSPSFRDVKTQSPVVNLRVRYVAEGRIKVAPIGSGTQIVFGNPKGWKEKPKQPTINASAPSSLTLLKKDKYMDAVIPLASRFAQIPSGKAKIPVRVTIQPFEGEWNVLEWAKNPNKSSSLIRLKPVVLTGYFTVEIPEK